MNGVSILGGDERFISPPKRPDRPCDLTSLLLNALSSGIKRPGHQADHISPSRAEVKNKWSYSSPRICLRDKHREDFAFNV